MENIFIPLIVILMIMVVVSLVRGIIAFMQSTRVDSDRSADGGASEMQLKQNRMMFNRIKFQAAAVIVVAVLLAASR